MTSEEAQLRKTAVAAILDLNAERHKLQDIMTSGKKYRPSVGRRHKRLGEVRAGWRKIKESLDKKAYERWQNKANN